MNASMGRDASRGWLIVAALACGLAMGPVAADEVDATKLADQVEALLAQLVDGDPARRDDAERRLIELGAASKDGDAFISILPSPDGLPQEMRMRLERVAAAVRAGAAKASLAASTVTLDVADAPLEEVLDEIKKQTGNAVVDSREQFGQEAGEKLITLKVDDEPFWSVLDKILDAAAMSPHPYSGEESLAIVDREPGALRRAARAAYRGPFRVDVVTVSAARGVRVPGQSNLQLVLEVAWEPRLRPLGLTQAAADIAATCDDGLATPPLAPEGVFDVEVQAGSHAADIGVGLQLPARRATTLTTVRGKITALVPGKFAEATFDKLGEAKDVSQEVDGVTVRIDRVVKNDSLWEVHMRIAADVLDDELASHRSWVFQNRAVLKDAKGEEIAHAGYEMTMQTKREIGFAYLYELPEGVEIGDCTWAYRTPAGLALEEIEYELKDVPLP